MKKNIQIAIASLVIGAISTVAFAESSALKMDDMMRGITNMSPRDVMQKIQEKASEDRKSPTPQVLDVNGQGQVRLRGIVSAVSSSTISIKTWGGVWTVLPGVSPEIISKDKVLGTINVGDYVGVQGTIVPDAILTVQGNVIRNRSWREEFPMPKMRTDGLKEINPQNTFSPKKESFKLVPIVSNIPTSPSSQTNDDTRELNPQNTFSPKKITPAGPSMGGSGMMIEGSKPPVRATGTPGVINIPLNY